MSALVQVRDAAVEYRGRRGEAVRALAGVDLDVAPGEVLGVVGESGCGKSTLGRAIVGLQPLAAGTIRFRDEPVTPLGRRARAAALRPLQMVFQDPYLSLNPRRVVGAQVADAARLAGAPAPEARRRAAAALERVGLPADVASRYPHEFSGGQRQRIAIARALVAEPACIVADEPISALDASAQAHIAGLLAGAARDAGVGLVFISHDLSVVRQIADRVAVMYLGTVVETGRTADVWRTPSHPYTEALIRAVPRADGAGALPLELAGEVPDPARPPAGCRFHPRCPVAEPACAQAVPPLRALADGRLVACRLQPEGGPPRSFDHPRPEETVPTS